MIGGVRHTSDKGIANIFQLQKSDDVVHISNLLLIRNTCRLTEKGRKDQGLLDCRCRFMNIKLLTVTSCTLEANALRSAIN